MSDQPQQQQIQLRIDESRMQTTYANTIRTATLHDEVVLDMGVNIPQQAPGQQPSMTFSVNSRVVMNWAGAKRLAITLGQAIRQYEERFGEISLQPPRPLDGGTGDAPPAEG
ncbi:MAG: DUF3467 domain-containing protein [Planctomycetota bacterium]